jgi:hypothetical protein
MPSKSQGQSHVAVDHLGDLSRYVEPVESDGRVAIAVESEDGPNSGVRNEVKVTLWGLTIADTNALDHALRG